MKVDLRTYNGYRVGDYAYFKVTEQFSIKRVGNKVKITRIFKGAFGDVFFAFDSSTRKNCDRYAHRFVDKSKRVGLL